MSRATSFASVSQQMSGAVGVAVAAICVEAIQFGFGDSELMARDLSLAFVLVAIVSSLSVFIFARLKPDAGAAVSGRMVSTSEGRARPRRRSEQGRERGAPGHCPLQSLGNQLARHGRARGGQSDLRCVRAGVSGRSAKARFSLQQVRLLLDDARIKRLELEPARERAAHDFMGLRGGFRRNELQGLAVP